MKLAIYFNTASTGGMKYLYFLLNSIKKLEPTWEISIFCSFRRDKDYYDKFLSLGVTIYEICKEGYEYKFKSHTKWWDNLYNFLRKKKIILKLALKGKKFVSLDDYDLIFCPWPYDMLAPKVSKKIVFIPHDFIYTHSFGLDACQLYFRNHYKRINNELLTFVDKDAVPVVSTPFIYREYKRAFPQSKIDATVIYLSHFSDQPKVTQAEIEAVCSKYNIKNEYIVFANNGMPHKNLPEVISAMYYVKQELPHLKLIVTGNGNADILGVINNHLYMDHTLDENNWDVKGIGLLSENDFNAIMQGSKMVINASLCEAGAGSALEAWQQGVPMVMSNIPAFMEQSEFLGTKAEFFNPKDCKDIARAIIKIATSKELAKENAEISRQALNKYTWEDVAKQYIDVFKRSV